MNLARAARSALGVLLLASAARAEIGRWTSIGPDGGVINFVAVAPSNPSTVYAGARDGGVFVSAAQGTDWIAANAGLTDLHVQCIAVSPSDARTVYVGTSTGGFQSVNGGGSWSALGGGFPAEVINSIAVDPSNPSTVYAAGTSGAVVKSTDAGATWHSIGTSVAASQPRVLAIDPATASVVYLGTGNGGVFWSGDGGATWTARNTGLADLHVNALAVDPTDPHRVYVGSATSGMYRSADSGANWSAIDDGIDPTQLITSVVVAADATVFMSNRGGVAMLAPGGTTWDPIPSLTQFPTSLAVGPGAVPPLYVSHGNPFFDPGGVARWDGGTQFTVAGIAASTVPAIAADPAAPGRALVGTSEGAWVYDPAAGADPWTNLSTSAGLPTTFLFDVHSPGTVYAGSAGGVWKSTDSGAANWASAVNGLPNTQPPVIYRALLPVPGNPQGFYAGSSIGLFVTADAAASWTAGSADLAGIPIYCLAADPDTATNLWAGTGDSVFRSTNGGQNWSRAGSAFGAIVRAILVLPSGRVLAATDGGLYASTNAGASWSAVGSGLPAGAVNALVADASGQVVSAGTFTGVYQSGDGGQTWASAGGPPNPNVVALALLPGGTLLAGTRGGSVYASAPAGAERGAVVRSAPPPSPRALLPRD